MFVYQRVSDSHKNRMKQRATIRACPAFDVSSPLQSNKKTPTFQAFTRYPARSLPEQSRNFKVRWPICARKKTHGTALAGGSLDLVGVYNQLFFCFEIRQPENIGKNWDDRRARSFGLISLQMDTTLTRSSCDPRRSSPEYQQRIAPFNGDI